MEKQVIKFNLELELEEVNIILKSLDEIPHKLASPIIKNIFAQTDPQIKNLTDQEKKELSTPPVAEEVLETE
jgi:hypothetical protein